MTTSAAAIELRGVRRSYPLDDPDQPDATIDALAGVDLTIRPGELVAVTGPSGSGKSTLLHLVGALDRPSAGEIRINGQSLSGLDATKLARLRNRTIGFVFQAFNLVPGLTAAENVALPAVLGREQTDSYRNRVGELLDLVGLTAKTDRLPGQLSGGEQQRVAVARALLMDPPIVLADEPTGNVDSRAGASIVDLLLAARDAGRTVVIVTHDHRIAAQTERIVHLRDGRIINESHPGTGPDRPLAKLLDISNG